MRLTNRRWLLVTLLGGLLAAALALPDWVTMLGRERFFDFNSNYYGSNPVQRALRRAIDSESQRNANLRAEAARAFTRQALAAQPAARNTDIVTWMPASPLPVSDVRSKRVLETVQLLADSIVRLRERAGRGAGAPVRVALIAMPAAIADGSGPLGVQRTSGSVTAWIVLPDSLGGATCAVAFKESQILAGGLMLTNPLGPCFWYAAFGAPGSAMTQFLQQQEFAGMGRAGIDRRNDSQRGAAPAMPQLFFELGLMGQIGWWNEPALQCLTNGGPACSESAIDRYARARGTARRTSATLPWTYGLQWPRSITAPSLATDLGPERFARLWRSDRPFADAFVYASGEPLDNYVRGAYVREFNVRYHAGPWPRLGSMAALLLVAGLCLALLFASDRRPSVA